MLSYKITGNEELVVKIQERRLDYSTRTYDYIVKKNSVVVYEGTAESAAWSNEVDAIEREFNFFDLGKKIGVPISKIDRKDIELINEFEIETVKGVVVVKTKDEGKFIEFYTGERLEYFVIDGQKFHAMRVQEFYELKGLLYTMSSMAFREYKKLG